MAAIFIIRPLRTSHQMASSVSIPELWKRTWTHQNDETTLSIMNNPIFCMHLAWTLHLPTITSLPLLLNYQHVTHHHQCSPIAEPRFTFKKKKSKTAFQFITHRELTKGWARFRGQPLEWWPAGTVPTSVCSFSTSTCSATTASGSRFSSPRVTCSWVRFSATLFP